MSARSRAVCATTRFGDRYIWVLCYILNYQGHELLKSHAPRKTQDNTDVGGRRYPTCTEVAIQAAAEIVSENDGERASSRYAYRNPQPMIAVIIRILALLFLRHPEISAGRLLRLQNRQQSIANADDCGYYRVRPTVSPLTNRG